MKERTKNETTEYTENASLKKIETDKKTMRTQRRDFFHTLFYLKRFSVFWLKAPTFGCG